MSEKTTLLQNVLLRYMHRKVILFCFVLFLKAIQLKIAFPTVYSKMKSPIEHSYSAFNYTARFLNALFFIGNYKNLLEIYMLFHEEIISSIFYFSEYKIQISVLEAPRKTKDWLRYRILFKFNLDNHIKVFFLLIFNSNSNLFDEISLKLLRMV